MEKKEHTGKVIWFGGKKSKGIGFIEWFIDGVKQTDLFLHFSAIEAEGYKAVKKDDVVAFQVGTNFHGKPIAINVRVITPAK